MNPGRGERRLLEVAVVVAIAAVAHGSLLGAWFQPFDDPQLLEATLTGADPTPHFRPLLTLWLKVLWHAFGENAGAWYATGIALHVGSSLLVGAVAVALGARPRERILASASFAALAAPSEAVAWLAASCGLLSVFFVLVALACYVRHLRSGRRAPLLVAVAAAALAAGAKEDAIALLPLVVALTALHFGRGRLFTRAALLRVAPFAAVAALHLVLAFDPSIWSERPDVGRYGYGVESVGRTLSSVFALAWPRRISMTHPPGFAPFVGAAIVALVLVTATRVRTARPALLVGSLAVLVGVVPVLPGPFEAPSASRYGYPSAIGVGWIVAGLLIAMRSELGPRLSRIGLVVVSVWVAASTVAVHSTVEWRHVRRSLRFEALVDATAAALDDAAAAPAGRPLLFVAPDVWNPMDFASAVRVFLRDRRPVVERADLDVALFEGGARGSFAEVFAHNRVLALGEDGRWRHVLGVDDAPLDAWRAAAAANAIHGSATVVPAIAVTLAAK
ncbi:MAG: hypothetical protein R3F34_15625 [Planctomycetota bacterium]